MTTYVVAFLSALAVSLVATPLMRRVARALRWLDRADHNGRKMHRTPVPRLGGIAIVVAFFVPLTALLIVRSGVGVEYKSSPEFIYAIYFGGVAIAVVGIYDDIVGARARTKLACQIGIAVALWLLGIRIEKIGHVAQLGVASLPFTVLWVVGVINAINLIDGLDGLASGVALLALATNFVLACSNNNILMCLVMASLAGGVAGFLCFNFNPASIFMGDTGSMFLGAMLAISSVYTSQKSGTVVACAVPVLALGLPLMDTFLAILRRGLHRQHIFRADRDHIHHRVLSRLRLTHRRAVLLLYGVSALFALVALGLAYLSSAMSAILLTGVSVIVLVLMKLLGYFARQPIEAAAPAAVADAIRTAPAALQRASTIDAMVAADQDLHRHHESSEAAS